MPSSFESFILRFLCLWPNLLFYRFLEKSVVRDTKKIKKLREIRKFRRAVKIARKWKPFRRFSIQLARETALAESAALFYQEAAECWQVVCNFRKGPKCKDWIKLAKAQFAAGHCDEALVTVAEIKRRYPSREMISLSRRLHRRQDGYLKVDRQVLADKPEAYKITYLKNKEASSTVVITFGTRSSDLFSIPFGFPFITEQGFDQIHVAQERFTFYQLLPLEVFLAAVGEICRGKNVIAYGSSIGAYAAFYFGGPLEATILAASPRNSVDPCLANSSREWGNVEFRHGKIFDNRKSPTKPVVFWDPAGCQSDRIFLEERILPAYPDTEIIAIPGGGHSTFRHLQNKKILKDVFLSVVRGDFSAEKVREELGLPPVHRDEQSA